MLNLIRKRESLEKNILPLGKFCFQYNDCSNVDRHPTDEFFSAAYYLHMLKRISDIAKILDKNSISNNLLEKFNIIKDEFNKTYFDEINNTYSDYDEASNILPLAFDLVPNDKREKVAGNLANQIKNNNYHLTCGVIALRYVFLLLADYGYYDVLFKTLFNHHYPSLLNILDSGCTCLSESWKGNNETAIGASMSHYFRGTVVEFIFKKICGFDIDNFDFTNNTIYLRPLISKQIGEVNASFKCALGKISIHYVYQENNPFIEYHAPEGVKVVLDYQIIK